MQRDRQQVSCPATLPVTGTCPTGRTSSQRTTFQVRKTTPQCFITSYGLGNSSVWGLVFLVAREGCPALHAPRRCSKIDPPTMRHRWVVIVAASPSNQFL